MLAFKLSEKPLAHAGVKNSHNNNYKIKENEKRDKYLDLAKEMRKLCNMKMTVILIEIGDLGIIPKRLERGLEESEIGRRIKIIQTTVKIDQNTDKSFRDLKTLATLQTQVKDLQRNNNNNNNNNNNLIKGVKT